MLESLSEVTLFGSIIWFYLSIAIVIVSIFVADSNDDYWGGAIVSLIAFAGLYYFYGENMNLIHYITWVNFLIYISIGILFAFLRVWIIARNLSTSSSYNKTEKNISEVREEIKSNFFKWVIIFPVCMISFIFSDVWVWMEKFFSKIFSKSIDKLFDIGLGKSTLKEIDFKNKDK